MESNPPFSPQMKPFHRSICSWSRSQGKLFEAEPCYRRALAIVEKGLGYTHPNTVSTLDGLASVLESIACGGGRANSMQRSFIKAHGFGNGYGDGEIDGNIEDGGGGTAVGDRDGGDGHRFVVRDCFGAIDMLSEAQALYERARASSEGHHGPDHHFTQR